MGGGSRWEVKMSSKSSGKSGMVQIWALQDQQTGEITHILNNKGSKGRGKKGKSEDTEVWEERPKRKSDSVEGFVPKAVPPGKPGKGAGNPGGWRKKEKGDEDVGEGSDGNLKKMRT